MSALQASTGQDQAFTIMVAGARRPGARQIWEDHAASWRLVQ